MSSLDSEHPTLDDVDQCHHNKQPSALACGEVDTFNASELSSAMGDTQGQAVPDVAPALGSAHWFQPGDVVSCLLHPDNQACLVEVVENHIVLGYPWHTVQDVHKQGAPFAVHAKDLKKPDILPPDNANQSEVPAKGKASVSGVPGAQSCARNCRCTLPNLLRYKTPASAGSSIYKLHLREHPGDLEGARNACNAATLEYRQLASASQEKVVSPLGREFKDKQHDTQTNQTTERNACFKDRMHDLKGTGLNACEKFKKIWAEWKELKDVGQKSQQARQDAVVPLTAQEGAATQEASTAPGLGSPLKRNIVEVATTQREGTPKVSRRISSRHQMLTKTAVKSVIIQRTGNMTDTNKSKSLGNPDEQDLMPKVAESKTPQKSNDAALDAGSSEKGSMPALGSIERESDMVLADVW